MSYEIDLSGKKGVVVGAANEKSIAWSIARCLWESGAEFVLTYQDERLKSRVEALGKKLTSRSPTLLPCDVTKDEQIKDLFKQIPRRFGEISFLIHSVAFANREDLGGNFSETSREGFCTALEVSAYSLLPLVKHAAPFMKNGGSVLTMTFDASQRVYQGYNIMGTAKAALEQEVRQLAAQYGPKGIRVNAISAGPIDTLAARGIQGFLDMKRAHAEKSPLHRNISADEVAKTALFLCSDMSSGITGSIIPVDAGYHIMAV